MTAGSGMLAYSIEDLLGLLDLDPVGPDAFAGSSPSVGWHRVFGGLVVAQALVAMDRTVTGRPAHSLHAYFMRPGDPSRPILYRVERLRDGGSFTTRRCVASQGDRPIFGMSASFHAPESDDVAHASPMPTVPPPDRLPSREDVRAGGGGDLPDRVRAFLGRDMPIEFRPVDLGRYTRPGPGNGTARQEIWMRASGRLPDHGGTHAAVLAYMSDMMLLDTALVPHGMSVFDPDLQLASLDHAVWFHRPFRADEWLLFSADSPIASGGRGFTRGMLFTTAGELVASVAQEGLVRRRRDAGREPAADA